jgi:hypothetical protein
LFREEGDILGSLGVEGMGESCTGVGFPGLNNLLSVFFSTGGVIGMSEGGCGLFPERAKLIKTSVGGFVEGVLFATRFVVGINRVVG